MTYTCTVRNYLQREGGVREAHTLHASGTIKHMSKYIKLTNKVHVPHILHLALYKNEKKQKKTLKSSRITWYCIVDWLFSSSHWSF